MSGPRTRDEARARRAASMTATAGKETFRVLWLSVVRTVVPVVVGAVMGRLVAAEIPVDPEFEANLAFALTAAGSGLYYVGARLLEVYVSPRLGWLLGAATSPDGYSPGAPPAGQADEDGVVGADGPQDAGTV